MRSSCHDAVPWNSHPSAVKHQSWSEDKFLLYPESVPIRILKKWKKWLPEFGIIAQLIDGSLQSKSEQLLNNGIFRKKSHIDPDPHNFRSRVDLFHQVNLITAFFNIALVDAYGVCPKTAYTVPQAHMPQSILE